ncbi:MAG TPA: lipid II flippase MurJ, partial [Myxococcota bacterium]|nr:lipid II flippase MurJ [Myxococcota bacterium]
MGTLAVSLLLVFASQGLALLQPDLVGQPVFEKAIALTRIVLPAQICFLLSGAWSGAQNFRRKFLFPSLAPLVYNLGIIGGGWYLARGLGAEGFVWGALGGAILGHFLLQMAGLRWAEVGWAWPDRMAWPHVRSFLMRSAPLMLGLTLGFSAEFLLKRLSGGLPSGSIAQATYAFRLVMVLVALFGQSTGVASYPYMVELAGTGQWERFQELISLGLTRLATFLVPATVAASLFAPEAVQWAYQRGAFGGEAAKAVSLHLAAMAWCIYPWCVQIVLARGFYAQGRFWLGAGMGTGCVLVSWAAWSQFVGRYGASGIGPGLVFMVGIQAVVFAVAWRWT